VIEDDPRLNARVDEPVKQPLRVVLDGNARLEPGAELFSVDGPVLVVTSAQPAADYSFDNRTECIQMVGNDGRVDLDQLLTLLAEKQVNEVMVEAGAGVAGAFIARDMVDEIIVYSSPDILSTSGRGMFVIRGIRNIENRVRLEIKNISRLGRDLKVTYGRTDGTG
jgi:diaminohydroxyphosphoribosylaminopyrimidine deaminase/5-amino-6-(5-phosphoribosylamino)uracil reductase